MAAIYEGRYSAEGAIYTGKEQDRGHWRTIDRETSTWITDESKYASGFVLAIRDMTEVL